MALSVDMDNPAPWLIHVTFIQAGVTMDYTWPFQTEEEAKEAYVTCYQSGQFRHTLTKATKKRPAVVVNLLSVWCAVTEEDGTVTYRQARATIQEVAA